MFELDCFLFGGLGFLLDEGGDLGLELGKVLFKILGRVRLDVVVVLL